MSIVEYDDWNFKQYTGSITKPSTVNNFTVYHNTRFVYVTGSLKLSTTSTFNTANITLPNELRCLSFLAVPFTTFNNGGSYGLAKVSGVDVTLTQTRQGSSSVNLGYFSILVPKDIN